MNRLGEGVLARDVDSAIAALSVSGQPEVDAHPERWAIVDDSSYCHLLLRLRQLCCSAFTELSDAPTHAGGKRRPTWPLRKRRCALNLLPGRINQKLPYRGARLSMCRP